MKDQEIPVPPHHHAGSCQCRPICAYLRVSAVMGRGDELISPELQLHEIATDAARTNRRIVKVIPDIDRSGRSFTKRRVNEAIKDIEAGLYKELALWKWSRWGRNMEQSLVHLTRVQAAGGSVRAVTEDFDPTTSTGRFSRDMLLRIAELQSDQIGEGWKETHGHRRREGLPHNAFPRFGYGYVKGEGYKIDPDLMRFVVSAYRAIAGGGSFRDVAAKMNARGMRTDRGGAWLAPAVRRVLDTGFCAGWIREKTNPADKRRGADAYDLWRKGSHPPIITERLWGRYKEARKLVSAAPPRTRVAARALSRMMLCGVCSELVYMVAGSVRGEKWWYCPRVRGAKAHRWIGISDKAAEAAVLAWICGVVEGGEDVDKRAAQLAEGRNAEKRIEALERDEATLRKNRLKLASDALNEVVDLEDAKVLREEIDANLIDVRAALLAARAVSEASKVNRLRAFTTVAQEWGRWTPDERRSALAPLVSRIVVHPGERPRAPATVECVESWEA